MAVPTPGTDDSIRLDLQDARGRLLAARSAQRAADTPATRIEVELCLARLDRLLDTWNERATAAGRGAAHETVTAR
ncbi:hypothetical protein [Trujillonella humicola]|uniref:hypothetical protein n=1 Tax=Trujillonella humicola TaxID=3383699 RepID=UPI0039061CA4